MTRLEGKMAKISSSVLALLTSQYAHEMGNHFKYLYRSTWARYRGLEGTADFFAKEAEGEKGHADLVRKYIEDRNEELLPSIDPYTRDTFATYPDLFLSAQAVERQTTEYLGAIYSVAFSEGDFMTVNWLRDLIMEQVEEEELYQTIIDRIIQRGGGIEDGTAFAAFDSDLAAVHDIDVWLAERNEE